MFLARNAWKTVVIMKNFCQRLGIIVKTCKVKFAKRTASY